MLIFIRHTQDIIQAKITFGCNTSPNDKDSTFIDIIQAMCKYFSPFLLKQVVESWMNLLVQNQVCHQALPKMNQAPLLFSFTPIDKRLARMYICVYCAK